MAKINYPSIQKKLNEALKTKIKDCLTLQEFSQVKFREIGTKLEWEAPKEIQEKIVKGLKK